jgi:NDP-sugar pyrophosphorylase family protein
LDDVPVIEVLVQQLRDYGITELTVVTGHLAELIRTFLGDGARFGVKIGYFKEETPLDTAGCLGLIQRPQRPFLVMNGDLLTTLNFNNMVKFHFDRRPLATIATYSKKVTIDLGVLGMDEHDRLTEYLEKPTHEFLVSMGIYCFEPRVCDFVEPGERLSMPELILRLKDASEEVLCYREDCYWLDIGRPEDYALATEEFRHNRSRFLPSNRAA